MTLVSVGFIPNKRKYLTSQWIKIEQGVSPSLSLLSASLGKIFFVLGNNGNMVGVLLLCECNKFTAKPPKNKNGSCHTPQIGGAFVVHDSSPSSPRLPAAASQRLRCLYHRLPFVVCRCRWAGGRTPPTSRSTTPQASRCTTSSGRTCSPPPLVAQWGIKSTLCT